MSNVIKEMAMMVAGMSVDQKQAFMAYIADFQHEEQRLAAHTELSILVPNTTFSTITAESIKEQLIMYMGSLPAFEDLTVTELTYELHGDEGGGDLDLHVEMRRELNDMAYLVAKVIVPQNKLHVTDVAQIAGYIEHEAVYKVAVPFVDDFFNIEKSPTNLELQLFVKAAHDAGQDFLLHVAEYITFRKGQSYTLPQWRVDQIVDALLQYGK